MASSAGDAKRAIGFLALRQSSRAAVVAALAPLLAAGAVSAERAGQDPRLSVTLVGALESGATGRLAVRWDGEQGALLDAWVDLDGDGRLAAEELVIDGRPLASGIEVVDFDVPADAIGAPQPRLWAVVREQGWRQPPDSAAESLGSKSRDSCAWQEGFFLSGLDGAVRALTVFDDGSGPALYVGGDFVVASGVVANHIARWDGIAWSALSGGGVSGGQLFALAVFDDGSGPALYAGGWFMTAGGVTVNGIARWDGTAWSSLSGPSGTGVNAPVLALAVFDDGTGPALFAGGYFTTAGGVTVNGIARWDGAAWSALTGPFGTGVAGDSYTAVHTLAGFDDGSGPALFAGGHFTTAGGVTVNNVARWGGSTWSALSGPSGTGVGGSVYALALFDDGFGPALYAGGGFGTAGGVTVNNVARWDGSTWSALSGPSGMGVSGDVNALAVFDDGSGPALYAGGKFGTAGGVTVIRVARWDGTAWSALSGPSGTGIGGSVYALAVFNDGAGPALYAGGYFTTAGGVAVNHLARWDGSAWSALSEPPGTGIDGSVRALAVFDDGAGPALYAGGYFATAGTVTANHVARWDGAAWSALSGPSGTGMNGGDVLALAVFNDGDGPALYAGGRFTAAGGVTVNSIARWDGFGWSPLSGPSGTGVGGSYPWVYALAVFDDGSGPALYAGGYFTTAGGVTVKGVARWDGTAWSALSGPSGTGVDGWVYALAAFDDGTGPALYAGGGFGTAGGVTVNRVARWDGTAWSALSGPSGTGVDGGTYPRVSALGVFDDGYGPALYAGGYFFTAGGVTVNHVARWNGSAWAALSGPSTTGVDNDVDALAVFDDGSGPALYAGGFFVTAGGVTVYRVARWEGIAWSALSGPSGIGFGDWVRALAVFDDATGPTLYAGGDFTFAGRVPSSGIAAWRCPIAIFADGFETGDTSAWRMTVP